MKGFEAFSKIVEDLEIGPVFGNPGSTELPMLRKIKNYYLTLHDSIAVGMADGYAQVSRKTALVNLHTMPGLGNSMAFIFTAFKDHAPLIITAGQQDTRHLVYDPLLSGDLQSLVSSFVKMKYEIKRTEDIPVIMKKAKDLANSPPKGPVFISFPMDLMENEIEYKRTKVIAKNYDLVDMEAIKYIADKLNSSKNPALVFGYEIDLYQGFKEAEELATKLGCAVYSEPLAHRSPFNTDSPYYGGDLMPATTMINLKLIEHDMILLIGADLTVYPYFPSPLLPGKEVIYIGFDPSYKIGESFIMNPLSFVRELTKHVEKKCNFKKKEDLLLANRIARARNVMGIEYVMHEAKKIFKDYTIVDESVSFSPNVRATFGYGLDKYFSSKTGQLGWASAAALGIALKKDKVLATIGDGSFMYTVQSLWTAKKYNLNVKFLVLNNQGYNILKSYAKSYYPELESAEFLNPKIDVVRIAKGFGVDAETAGKDLIELQWLSEGNETKVLEVNVDKTVQKLFL